MKDFILMLHPTFGILAVLAAVWVFVDALNAGTAPPRASAPRPWP